MLAKESRFESKDNFEARVEERNNTVSLSDKGEGPGTGGSGRDGGRDGGGFVAFGEVDEGM